MRVVALLLVALALEAQDLPDGKGKDVVVRLCTGCHTADQFTGLRMSKDGWETVVTDMASRGATGTDAEFAAVTEYLATHFGQTNVNKASAEELKSGLSLSGKDVAAIIKYRADKGPFHSLKDLLAVPGIDAAHIESQKDNISF